MAKITNLSIGKDINGFVDYTIEPSETTYITVLAANTEQTLIVPDEAEKALFSYSTGDVFVSKGETSLVIPSSPFFLFRKVDYRPAGWSVYSNDILRFISTASVFVCVKFYKCRNY